eukprot:CAMPEP_0116556556 /NCGR_PEP_ID=MMETSP0397-20121206/8760_1 /TAXON_ID=216820 /ORGANISM="Cyclophora tenuis, Strain ECT3854" /LENGTH=285 /DNA_ID=CAMNT_0004081935 /DNA_START=17 /DNA_END=875 /DNA_ORIENTATION=+
MKPVFLPLTHEPQDEEEKKSEEIFAMQDSIDYWDWKPISEDYFYWPATTENEEKEKKNDPAYLLSVDHIVANLMKDAAERRHPQDQETKDDEKDECDNDSPPDDYNNNNNYYYWDWSTSPHSELFSASHMEMRLTATATTATTTTRDELMIRSTMPSSMTDEYWRMKTTTKEEEKTMIRRRRRRHRHDDEEEEKTKSYYWNWPSNRAERNAFVASFMTEKEAQEILRGDRIERLIVATASDMYWREDRILYQQDTDYYWQWNNDPSSMTMMMMDMNPIDYWTWKK